jgi:hypothetical protein
MQKWMRLFLVLVVVGLLFPLQAFCGGAMSNEQIVEELKALRDRITELENQVRKKDQEITELREHGMNRSAGGPETLGDRVRRIEEQMEKGKEDLLGEHDFSIRVVIFNEFSFENLLIPKNVDEFYFVT